MVGHVKEGYEGYSNSTPTSPTKYTVNKARGGGYMVSKQCIVIAAFAIGAAMLLLFLVTYFAVSASCEKSDPRLQAALTNGNTKNTLKPYDITTIPFNEAKNYTNNLSHDQIDIRIEDDDGDGIINPTTDYHFGESDEDMEVPPKNNFRLPRDLSPLHYEIKIIPFFQNLSTYGDVNITIKCINATNQIILNWKDLNIQSIDVSYVDTLIPVLVENFIYDEEREMISIFLKQQLEDEKMYYVRFKYYGDVRRTPNGLYISYFDNEGKTDSSMISTLFSPTFARGVFPSFDEPSFKSTFTFIIGRQTHMFSLSNMNKIASELIYELPSWVWDHYQKSPLMSTYLTAFLVAPSNSLKRNVYSNSTNPIITLCTRPHNSFQTDIGLNLAEQLIKYFERYFGIKYPLPKIDIVAVPNLAYGAMENWGLITFREEKILADRANSVTNKQSLSFMLAHEIAHQWFGNLVTPEWWNDIWLKEGFSTYFQYVAINELNPTWEVFNEFSLIEMEKAFLSDGMATSYAITKDVNKPSREIFDGMPYHKGASLIRMMVHFLGDEKLKMGLSSYLNHFIYGNANQKDLWDHLSKDGYGYDKDKIVQLNTIMDTWTQQAGYPVITVTRNYAAKTAEIRQERFLFNGKKDNTLWWVPISYTSRIEKQYHKTYPKYWMPAEENITISKLPNNESWILLNGQGTGFYRVNYDFSNWILLINDYRNLPPGIKAQLIKDSFNLARGGRLQYEIPLSIAAQLSSEVDYLPWLAVSQVFDFLKSSIIKMPAYEYFQLYVAALVRTVYSRHIREIDEIDRVPWIVPDSPIDQRHAENIINLACSFQESHCVSTAKIFFQNWMSSPENGNSIPVAVRSIVYCTAVREGGHKEWMFAYKNLFNPDLENVGNDAEKTSLLKALGCSAKPWLSTKALGSLTRGSGLSKKDGMILFKSVASNIVGHWIALSFIQSEWERMLDFYESPNPVYEMVCSVVNYINSPYEIEQINQLVNKIVNKTKERSDILSECLERAENNKIWIENKYVEFSRWLENFVRSYELL